MQRGSSKVPKERLNMVGFSFVMTRVCLKNVLSSDEVVALVDVNKAFLWAMTTTVEKYLNNCGRRWVELDGLFSFMKI
jgi:DNA Polymerase alpha zinc finger